MPLRKATECSNSAISSKTSLGLAQRTPASSAHIDKNLENQRVRTGASTPALVPLVAVLIAAQPMPAREDVLAFLGATTSFSLSWVGFRIESCVKIGSENVVSWRVRSQAVTLHWRMSTTPLER